MALSLLILIVCFGSCFFGGAVAQAGNLQFEVAHRIGEKYAHVTVMNGMRGAALKNGFTVAVNGTLLKSRVVPRKGLAYAAELPNQETYEMTLRGPGAVGAAQEIKLVVTERKFEPALVDTISTRRDLIIPFTGSQISSREKLLVKLISTQKLFLNRRSVVLTAVLDGSKIVIPMSSLKSFKAGQARLHVALLNDQSETATKDKTKYTVSLERRVSITAN